MRIVHFNTVVGRGGAAQSTQLLCNEQRRVGHDPWILATAAYVPDERTRLFDPGADPSLAGELSKQGWLYYQYQGSHKLLGDGLVSTANVLHFHNLHGGYFNPFSVLPLSRTKPVVWTLRDMQAITGHCAHALDCERWQTGCGSCERLSAPPAIDIDNTATLWTHKKLIARHSILYIVCPSEWLRGKAKKSLLKDHPIRVIPNGVDTAVFYPFNKSASKRELGVGSETFVLGMVAERGVANVWKGATELRAVARGIADRSPKCVVVSVGNEGIGQGGEWRDGIRCLPRISDRMALAKVYSAFDCLLSTSIAETFSLVTIEAMACGVPVIAFATGGVPELVRSGTDGIIVPYLDVRAFVDACVRIGGDADFRRFASSAARQHAVEVFDIRRIANQYEAVYSEAIELFEKRAHRSPVPLSELPSEVLTRPFLDALHSARLINDDAAGADKSRVTLKREKKVV